MKKAEEHLGISKDKQKKGATELKPKEKSDKSKKDVPEAAKLEDEAEAASAADVAQKAGETWAISFFANIALMAVVFGMANTSNKAIRSNTWFVIDQVALIFLAV